MEGRGTGKKEGISESIAEHTEKAEPVFLRGPDTPTLAKVHIKNSSSYKVVTRGNGACDSFDCELELRQNHLSRESS